MFSVLFKSFFMFAPPIQPCAIAPRESDRVVLQQEDAIIIWDGKTQHFIREANFDSTGEDFGFLVPTPSIPKLEEIKPADKNPLHILSSLTDSPVSVKTSWDVNFMPLLLVFLPQRSMKVQSTNIAVYETQVAGMDAAVLRPENVEALSNWLTENNYPYRPELQDWAQHYINQGWYLTAFKISKAQSNQQVKSGLVHMEFDTEAPFYPYFEPTKKDPVTPSYSQSRRLNLYYFSPQKPNVRLGDNKDWSGEIVYAKPLDSTAVFANSGIQHLVAEGSWLTLVLDRSVQREPHDLWFEVAGDATPIERPTKIDYDIKTIWLPLDVVVGGVITGVAIWLANRNQ